MRSSNPILKEETYDKFSYLSSDAMTVQGTVNKTIILFALLMVGAVFAWSNLGTPTGLGMLFGGAIGGLIVFIIMSFKKEWSPILAPIYALLEGLVVGGISGFFEAKFAGIVFQATTLTFGVFFILLFLYKSGIIRATNTFKKIVIGATGAIALLYLVNMVLTMFGIRMPIMYSSSPLSIGLSLVVVAVAALNLVLDFDFIEEAARYGAPKYMEWYSGVGLLVTLIWLYFEILRLLSKLNSRD